MPFVFRFVLLICSFYIVTVVCILSTYSVFIHIQPTRIKKIVAFFQIVGLLVLSSMEIHFNFVG